MRYVGPGLFGIGPRTYVSGIQVALGEYIFSPTDKQIYKALSAGTKTTDPAMEVGPTFDYEAVTYTRITSWQIPTAATVSSISSSYPDVNLVALSSNPTSARTRILSLTGKGIMSFLAVGLQMQFTGTVRVEIICDGRTITDYTVTSFVTNQSMALVGSGSAASADSVPLMRSAVNDPLGIPFQRSFELWLTPQYQWYASANSGFRYRVRADA